MLKLSWGPSTVEHFEWQDCLVKCHFVCARVCITHVHIMFNYNSELMQWNLSTKEL